ncbi:FAD-dependent monooxygenase [Nocardia terpenica]|uniref:FAD-dependent oxidoreductase n=1 Tax=Nocardia terpenica TaxID=455432 RepID=UPI0018958058|nr:FAD-dependent monooxygenase [Nocardia terpenica]MBF6062817.1 FAD-dependent monooxygenase [Nocardia terpenica]MBF6105048.1 FAD-dependent monooxygenase [Nocardia terpenica]MBF6112515.1 FAD-dependent monooxygenase [Nocardia terpenica]MBF6118776.1 FAD-dependent monooxygenase [Nocardia terpenica]MBF6154245.1 FAD-dependent monooxygenase [Nocardia terpenica]
MTNALIIGSGIAGPVTAMALQKVGIESVIHEARPRSADAIRAIVTVFANGMDALRAVESDLPVLDCSFPAERSEAFDSSGRPLGQRSMGGLYGVGPRTLTHAKLCQVLRDEAASRGLRIEYGKRLTTATHTSSGRVVACFDDGSHAEGDLLIGADGVHSTLRRIVDPAAVGPLSTGSTPVCGYTRNPAHSARLETYRMFYGSRTFFAYTTAPDGETWWFTAVPTPPMKNADHMTTPAQWKQRAVDILAGDHIPAADIIRCTDDIVAVPAYHLPALPVWHTGHMILVGDAAHATEPNAGHGASMAMEDGVVLAQCLRDLPTVQDAFTAYDRLRRPRVTRLVTISARMSKTAVPAGPFRRTLRDAVLLKRLKGRARNTADWLTNHHIDWNTPIPPNLAGDAAPQ